MRRLDAEHESRVALAAYERLRADEQEWASYREEAKLTDDAAGDWLHHDARD